MLGPPEPSEDPEVTRGLQPSPDDLVLHVYFCSCRKNFKRPLFKMLPTL